MAADYSRSRNYPANRRRPRQKNRLGRFVMLVLVVSMAALLMRSRIFVIQEIRVVGNSVKSSQEVAALSGLTLGMSIYNVNKDTVAGNLSADPYVEVINVRTEMPHTVVLEIRERTPCAAVNCAGVILLTDQEGFILERLNHLPENENVIVVSGMNVSVNIRGDVIESHTAGQMQVMKRLLSAICASPAKRLISELNLSDLDNLYLVSNSGIQVLLGTEEMIEDKLIWMQAVLEKLTANGIMKGVVDVSSGKNAVYAER